MNKEMKKLFKKAMTGKISTREYLIEIDNIKRRPEHEHRQDPKDRVVEGKDR